MLEVSPATRNPASYRDPSGFVFGRNGCVLRQINRRYQADYDRLMASGLYADLVASKLLLAHEDAPLQWSMTGEACKILRPAQLPLVSYPYEWCFSQLRDAALLTLEIERRALAHGMSLKDASAYNVQFYAGRPVLIDILSLEQYNADRPWVAYRQFCQHFLAPLALMSKTDVRLSQLLRTHLDGVPLDLASRLLPWRTRFSMALGLHVHAHARSQQKHAESAKPIKIAPKFSRRKLEAILASLESAICGLKWNVGKTEWSDYYAANHNYGAEGLQIKEALVRELIGEVQPRTVWDLGANNGRFSRTAAQCGAELVASWDSDPACVEHNYRQTIERRETTIHPLWVDLTNPSPGIGWGNSERMSFGERGPADLLLALGLVHHLAIGSNVPLDKIAALLAGLGRWLIVEWIPKEDSQVQRLLASRADVFFDYQQPQFEREFQKYFSLQRVTPLEGTRRTLYLMRALQEAG